MLPNLIDADLGIKLWALELLGYLLRLEEGGVFY